jgi:hypothetical protein
LTHTQLCCILNICRRFGSGHGELRFLFKALFNQFFLPPSTFNSVRGYSLVASWSVHMRSSPTVGPAQHRGRLRIRPAWFCLIAILVHFSLPLFHACQVSFEEQSGPYGSNAPSGALQAALRVGEDRVLMAPGSSEKGAHHHSHHNPAACSVCQALLGSSSFMASCSPARISAAALIAPFLPAANDPRPSGDHLAEFSPRAPPPPLA